jgi:heat shock protein HslJ
MKKMHLFLMIFPVALLVVLSACSPNSSGLAGTTWKLASYGPISAPTLAVTGVETQLTFGADGKMSGNLGCNSMGGDYSVTNQSITFGSVFMTEMACDEPRMSQEGAAFQVLQDTATFKINGNTLTIISSDGSNILTFVAIASK